MNGSSNKALKSLPTSVIVCENDTADIDKAMFAGVLLEDIVRVDLLA